MGFLSELELLIKYISLNKEISFLFLFAFFIFLQDKKRRKRKPPIQVWSKQGQAVVWFM